MTIHRKTLLILNLIYCYMPCLCFLLGWCRIIVSLPVCLLLMFLLLDYARRINRCEFLLIRRFPFFIILALSVLICTLLGMGGLFANFYDYEKHSMIIQDLIAYKWPVIYNENEPAMLTYYMGQYLFPCLFGKLTRNSIVAELLMGVFGWLGVLLLYFNLMFIAAANNGKKQMVLFFLFIMFSGMLMPLQIVSQMKTILNEGIHTFIHTIDPHWYSIGSWNLQYRSTLTAIKWVYPQYIIPSIGAVMLYWDKDTFKNAALIILPSIICGTWGFVCLVILVLLMFIITCLKRRQFVLEVFSRQNVITVLIGGIFFAFFLGNLMSEKPDYMKLHLITSPKYYVLTALPFVIFMFGFYVLLVWKEFRNDVLFLSVVIILTVIPCFRMGYYNDFVMCTSMPALFILSAYIFKYILNSDLNSKLEKRKKMILCMCLLLASASPLLEITSSFPKTMMSFPKRTLSCYTDRNADVDAEKECMKYNYFTYEYENTFFYKYIARK